MSSSYTKRYVDLYLDHQLTRLYFRLGPVRSQIMELMDFAKTIGRAIESLRNSIARNDKDAIELDIFTILDKTLTSMLLISFTKQLAMEQGYTKDKIIDVLNKLDNANLGFLLIHTQIEYLTDHLRINNKGAIEHLLRRAIETYQELLTHLEALKQI